MKTFLITIASLCYVTTAVAQLIDPTFPFIPIEFEGQPHRRPITGIESYERNGEYFLVTTDLSSRTIVWKRKEVSNATKTDGSFDRPPTIEFHKIKSFFANEEVLATTLISTENRDYLFMIGNHGYMAQFDLSDQTPDLTYERYAPKYDFRSVASEGYKIYLGSKGGTLLELALDGRGVPQNNMLPFPKKLIWKSETKEDGIFSITEILPVTGGGYAPFILAAANSLVFINQGSDRFVQFDEQDLFFTKQAPGLFKFAYQYQSDSSLLLVGTSLHQGKLVTGVYNYRFDPVKEEWRLLLGIPEFDQFFFDTTESICKPIMLTSGFFGYAYGHDDEGIYYLKTAYLNSNNNILEQFQLPVGTSELHTTHFDTKLKELFVGEVNGRLTGFLVGYPKTVLDKNKLETKQIARIKPKLLYERYLLEGLEFQGRETQALKAGSSRAYAASLSNFLAQNENIHIVLDAHAGGKGDDSNEETINRALTFRDMMVEYHPQIKNRIRCENKYDYYPVNRDSDNIINRTIIFRIEKF